MVLSQIDLDEIARVGSKWDGRTLGRPGDRDTAIDAIAIWYRLAGISAPSEIVWCEGPRDLAARLARYNQKDAAGSCLRSALIDEARETVALEVQRHVDAIDRSRIQARLGLVSTEALRRSIASEVASYVSRQISAHHARQLGWLRLLPWLHSSRTPRDLAELAVSRYSASWLAIYQVLGEVCGLAPYTQRLQPLWTAALSAGWIVPYRNICWATALPSSVHVDRHSRLHNPTGAALEFPDGWKLHAWKGVAVPAEIIDDRAAIDGHAIARQADPVLRRCMLEIMTPERFVREGEATCVATDDCGRLWRRRWPNGDVWAAVEVLNGTPEHDGSIKHYFLQVPPGVRTAREAVAWTYGLTELRYMALKKRT